jgi:predicted nucleic acid-binding protein
LDGDEPAAARVEEVIDARPWLSWINLAEVYYRVHRDHGRVDADTVVRVLSSLCRLDVATPDRTLEAARVKAAHAIALADCFAVATAAAHDVALLTGDPELIEARRLGCRVEDIRPLRNGGAH